MTKFRLNSLVTSSVHDDLECPLFTEPPNCNFILCETIHHSIIESVSEPFEKEYYVDNLEMYSHESIKIMEARTVVIMYDAPESGSKYVDTLHSFADLVKCGFIFICNMTWFNLICELMFTYDIEWKVFFIYNEEDYTIKNHVQKVFEE